MRNILCINPQTNCDWRFNSEEDLQSHKQSGHTMPGIPLEVDGPIPLSKEAPPPPEFVEAIKRIETPKPAEPEEPRTTTGGVARKELPEAKPVKLTYSYIGECSEHRTPITTIEVDADKKHFCIAFCPPGNHQIESREVAKLA